MDCRVHGVTKSWTQLSDFQFHFHSNLREVIVHCSSDLHLPDSNVEHLFMCFLAIHMCLLCRNVYLDLLPIFNFFLGGRIFLTRTVWVFFQAFYYVLLISVSVPVPYCFDDWSLVVQSEVRASDSSSSIFLPQDCFGCSGSFVFPYKLFCSCCCSTFVEKKKKTKGLH